MSSKFVRPFMQLTVVVALAAGLGACETISDLDPTGLLSDDSAPAAGDNATTPDLAGLPDAPPTTTPDDQKKVADALSADGSKAQYDANALRAGTEASAQAPGAAAPMPAAADLPPPTVDAAAPAPAASDAPPSTDTAAPPPNPGAAPMARPVAATPPPSSSPPVQTAALAPMPPPGAEPAVPPLGAPGTGRGSLMAAPALSDAALGFKPSSAPPLDPSVSKFVSAPILSRYRQTASVAGIDGAPAVAAVPGRNAGQGGPDMSGAVVANLGVLGTPGAASAAMNGGVTPTATVYFPGDGTGLTAAARVQVRAAVTAFKASGGAGSIRVVGHASSRTADMPVEKHLEVIFAKSQQRANAVAQELIREGVPAAKVVIEAVGDSQPIYYESMPKGEDGNRRTEIFVQG